MCIGYGNKLLENIVALKLGECLHLLHQTNEIKLSQGITQGQESFPIPKQEAEQQSGCQLTVNQHPYQRGKRECEIPGARCQPAPGTLINLFMDCAILGSMEKTQETWHHPVQQFLVRLDLALAAPSIEDRNHSFKTANTDKSSGPVPDSSPQMSPSHFLLLKPVTVILFSSS